MGKLVKPRNKLKNKVGHGGFKDEDLKKAQKAIDENDIDFEPIARDLFAEIEELVNSEALKDDDSTVYLGKILDPLMKLRAQGALFHYPSLTQISDVMVDFLDTEKAIDDDVIDIIAVYRKAGDAILSRQIKDAKNKICLVFITELRKACQRYQQKKK